MDAIGGAAVEGEEEEGLSRRLHAATSHIAKLEGERARLIKSAIASLASLRGYLVRSLAGSTDASMTINGHDHQVHQVPRPVQRRLKPAELRGAELAAVARKRLEISAISALPPVEPEREAKAVTDALPRVARLPAIPQNGGATSWSHRDSDPICQSPSQHYRSSAAAGIDSVDGGGSPPKHQPHPPTSRPPRAPRDAMPRTSRQPLPSTGLSEGEDEMMRRHRGALRRAQAGGEPLYTVFYSRLYDSPMAW